ncbi:MAG: Eco57I restriction-modification methylase domain-containing protein [Candidatus Woesearchaeota archaeon]
METELFNPKTVKRLTSQIKLKAKQKKAASEWLSYLESGKLKDEKVNYFRFGEIILRDLLGYDIKDMNFETGNIEFSFKDDSGRTVLGIEAKGTKVKDLFKEQKGYRIGQNTPINQLWTYMGQLNLDYGIATNYRHFVLIDRSKGFSTYHLFDFEEIRGNEEKLREFIAIFSKEQIIDKGFIEKLEEESAQEERNFTKEFYKLFHETRLMLVTAFKENGADHEKAVHFAQIYLNRLMFIFFVEDTGKVKARLFEESVISVLKSEMLLNDQSVLVNSVILSLFKRLNEGSTDPVKIFGFNGGLFKEEIPSDIQFKDFRKKEFFKDVYQNSKLKQEPELDPVSQEVFGKYKNKLNPIIKNLLLMASFDFKTEVSVNILGHIFEQSLSDIEKIKEGVLSKRKKEGIFYTPEYITDYICRNTIIPALSKKNATTPRDLVLEYQDDISELEKKFKELKVLDPACGSGAFLIKAVDILLEIHKEVQLYKEFKGEYTAKFKRKKKKLQGQMTLTKWNEEDEARKIIENNIHGVDINEESVEITKLSLFLKIAKQNKKLLDLSGKIKVGDSIVSDPAYSSKAFDWNKEFKSVMDKGGFDVVIGNPPYVRQEILSPIKPHLQQYKTYHGMADLYVYFVEKGINLVKQDGYMSYIFPNKFMRANYGKPLRVFIKAEGSIMTFINFDDLKVFEDATTYPAILVFRKSLTNKKEFDICNVKEIDFANFTNYTRKNSVKFPYDGLDDNGWNLVESNVTELFNKIKIDSITFKDYTKGEIYRGVLTGFNEAFVIDEEKRKELIEKDQKSAEIIKPFLTGREIQRYHTAWKNHYLILTEIGVDIERYPAIYEHLNNYKKKLEKRYDKGKHYYELRACNYYSLFEKPKVMYNVFQVKPSFTYDDEGYYMNNACWFSPNMDKYILGILNSKLGWFLIRSYCTKIQNGYQLIWNYLEKIPIKMADASQKEAIIKKVDAMLSYQKEFRKQKDRFIERVKDNLKLEKVSNKVASFYELSFSEFEKELKKAKIKLTLKQQDEWQDYFESYKKELIQLQEKINKVDEEIDELVFELYGLNEEEISIINHG